jgi:site-specific DNA recombinase
MLRYALYCRKSDKDDGDTIKSIEDQRNYWTERAAELGLVICEVYEENKSAMVPDTRAVYRQMVRDLQHGRVDAVLVWHVSRLARNVKEAGEFAQLLVDGVIQEVRTPNARYTPADNVLPLLLEQGSAVQQSRDLSRNMKLSQERMVKAGGWPHEAQIGYLNARDPLNARRGIIVPDPERFPLIRRGMDMMLTGLYSMRQVVDAMNSWGLRTRPTDKKSPKPLAYSRGYALFADPFYAGFLRYRGVIYPGRHTPMLTPDEYIRLQEIRQRHVRTNRRRHSHLYAGLMRCGLCGYQVTGEVRKKRERQYVYYHCSDSRKRCTKRAISQAQLERTILGLLQALVIDEEAARVAREEVRRWLGQGAVTVGQTRGQQEARLVAIDRERKALLDLLVDGTLRDKALYLGKEADLLAERNNVAVALQRGKDDLRHIAGQADAILSFATNAAVEFAAAGAERKRALAGALGFQYTLRNREVTVTVDPTLEKVVTFARQKTRLLEPGVLGSTSQFRPSFHNVIPSGGPAAESLETLDDLINALRESHFPTLYAQSADGSSV